MYVKSMVVDGFKSYGQRTEIGVFDRLFNAITGLNGSGKSNILDAICFLLGITNLSQVRATNLQELVYKNGQAGITKATVSITFDNRDKAQSPLGYEQYDDITVTRQVVIGGRNKYLINGTNAQNSRVQDLFRSVQLNVNNPHFLIMQGRVTKVLNMKPLEILSMIEEAAGTRMYENKKLSAQKTIEKKDARLKEIDSILDEEITPTLSKLKEERASYLEFQKVQRELEHLTKLYVAYQFVCAQETSAKSKDDLVTMQQLIVDLEKRIEDNEAELGRLNDKIEQLERARNDEAGGRLAQLEAVLKEKQAQEARIGSNLNNLKEAKKSEANKLKGLKKTNDEDGESAAAKEAELAKLMDVYRDLEQAERTDSDELKAAEKLYEAVQMGKSANDQGEAATLADQLIAAKNAIANSETESKQATMKLTGLREEISKKEAELKQTERAYQKDRAAFDTLKTEVDQMQVELSQLPYQPGQEDDLLNRKRALQLEINQLKDKLDKIESRMPNMTFDYDNPVPNFDRSKVKGYLCKLLKVKDVDTSLALEITAGGRLYNVVIDNEGTGKLLLDKGHLQRRTTFIPLNKIQGRTLSQDVIRKARNLVGPENVFPALSLVDFDSADRAAMEYVFGSAFICTDMAAAKAVTYNDAIRTRCVTLGGESYDPQGTLTGGSRPKTTPVLTLLLEAREVMDEMEAKQQELADVDAQLARLRPLADRYKQTNQRLDLKRNQLNQVKAALEQTTHHQQMENVEALKKTLDEQTQLVANCKTTHTKATVRVMDLEDKIKNGSKVREQELKEAEQRVKACKKKAELTGKKAQEKQREVEVLRMELEEMKKGIDGNKEQMEQTKAALERMDIELEEAERNQAEAKKTVVEAQDALQRQKDLLKSRDKEIQETHGRRTQLDEQNQECRLKIKQTEHDIGKHKNTAKDAQTKMDSLLKTHEWIAEERKYFGQPNTAFDFAATDPVNAGRRLQKLEETKDKLAKNVNMRAMNMLGKAEEQYTDLMRKKRIVENDKAKIAQVIKELDEKKNVALKTAWEQVNKDFGSIFSTLLPGTSARLVPPTGSVLDGLEVKVAFGQVWKESLGELSGGQRSLVALSLILSLLLFKPAPIYILDEVDAALDLSHTQNIGQMLRTHFPYSQFIVVSLKDGMFNNANVLFKTRFVDGMSTVTRFSQRTDAGWDTGASQNSAQSRDKGSKRKH